MIVAASVPAARPDELTDAVSVAGVDPEVGETLSHGALSLTLNEVLPLVVPRARVCDALPPGGTANDSDPGVRVSA